MEIVLASTSPRRAELLKQIGIGFKVVPSRLEEGQPVAPWSDWVQELARSKAQAAAVGQDSIVLGADTIVVINNLVLGKPRDEEEALWMLTQLSGACHEVMTGLCVLDGPHNRIYQDVEITRVYFRKLAKREIEGYAASGEPLDKAGAYGIQGLGALLVDRIEGDYFNIVGLPLVRTMKLLRRCGLEIMGAADE